jgi:PEGA domain-containing protein
MNALNSCHVRVAMLVAVALAASGCATLFASKTTTVRIESDPPQADIMIDGNAVGQTPASLEVATSKSHAITIQKAGYHPAGCTLQATVGAGWVVLDIIAGLLPAVIDLVTSDWSSLERESCSVHLAQDGASGPKSGELTPSDPVTAALKGGAADGDECERIRSAIAAEKDPRTRYEIIRKMPSHCHAR